MPFPADNNTIPTTMQGTTILADGTDDHALMHRELGSASNTIIQRMGYPQGTPSINTFFQGIGGGSAQWGTAGTNLSFGSSTFNNGTFSGQIQNNGTIANGVYGTSLIQGGTANSLTLGTPTIQGSVQGSFVGSANILNGNVVEEKVRMNLLKGTTLTSGTTASLSLVGVVGGSVTINLPIASNVMIYFSAWTSPSGGGNPLYALYVDGTIDSTWIDTIGQYNPIQNSFTAWRTGYAAGNHTWQIQWRVTGGTISLGAFELVVQPFSQ